MIIAVLLATSLFTQGIDAQERLDEAFRDRDLTAVERLIDGSPSPKDAANEVLYRACESLTAAEFNLSVAKVALGRGADPNHSVLRVSAAYRATWSVQTDLLRLLLQSGADPNGHSNSKSMLGQAILAGSELSPSALSLRQVAARTELVTLLLDAGADPNRLAHRHHWLGREPQGPGARPIHIAAYLGVLDVAELLVRREADVNARQGEWRWPDGTNPQDWVYDYMPLHCAAMNNRPENAAMVRFLLAKGADPNARDALGRTPRDIAAARANSLILAELPAAAP